MPTPAKSMAYARLRATLDDENRRDIRWAMSELNCSWNAAIDWFQRTGEPGSYERYRRHPDSLT